MTDNEIIKALEVCGTNEECYYCPLNNISGCMHNLMMVALDLIKRQQEMIDSLIAGQETLQKHFADKLDSIVNELEERADDCKRYWENFGDEDEISIMLGYKRAIGVVKGAINDR